VKASKESAVTGYYLHTAYLLSRYPAVSHTFFLQEVEGLKRSGAVIETASINLPDREWSALTAVEREAAEKTFYIKAQRPPEILGKLISILFLRPGVFLRGLKAALRMEPGHIPHTCYALFYLAEAILLGDWMRRRELTHLHVHFSGPVASVGLIASVAWKFPYSMTVHGPDEFFDQTGMALAQKIQGARFVICISDYCRSQLMRLLPPEAWKKLHVVRLGIAPALAEDPYRELAAAPINILCTGRLVSAKGQAILLMAMAELVRRNLPIHLRLIGDGPDRKALERLVDEKGLRHHVTFMGAQNHDTVLAALRDADLFVLPSFAEGVPVALMEAMAIGVPCISTFVAGIPELIRHERDGLLVPAGSVEELTAAMDRLIHNPDERNKFRGSARARVLEHYNLPKNLELLAATFRQSMPNVHAERLATNDGNGTRPLHD